MDSNKTKADVLDQIAQWADQMSMDRVKGRKNPQMAIEIEAKDNPKEEGAEMDPEDKLDGGKDEAAEGDMPEHELSLEDLMKLEEELKQRR